VVWLSRTSSTACLKIALLLHARAFPRRTTIWSTRSRYRVSRDTRTCILCPHGRGITDGAKCICLWQDIQCSYTWPIQILMRLKLYKAISKHESFLTILLCCKAALANNRGATVAGQRSDRYPQVKKDYSALGQRGATTI